MVHNIFKGLGIALITPFKEDGSVDYESLIRLIDYQLNNGADFFCILATTGETPTLTAAEKLKIKDLVVDYVQGRVPILMGCGGYNTAAVVEELKTGDFKSSYLGQLMSYLSILDAKVKKPHENSSIGIVLCKAANREYVEFVIRDYNKPMGVATYKTSAEMPEELRKALPDIEELKKLL